MVAALDVLAGKKPSTKVLFGGLSGNPVFLELKTTSYRNELEAIMRKGLRRVAREGPENIRASLDTIVDQMQNAAQRRFPMALKIGLGPRQIDADDDRTIELALASNAAFLSNSLKPAVEARIQKALDEGKTLAEAIAESEAFAANRSSLYAGAFWTLIWSGRLSALLKKFGPRANGNTPVMRVLDPRAKHCATCPQKAGVYSSWDEMLILTGGLPADGSDDCHSNCRCRIKILDGGKFTYVI
jgi:hypothetical protein